MELNDVAYVPSFTKNLVSGIQIMNRGYKQIIENGKLKIFKNDELVATGKYDVETGLIKMDSEITQKSIILIHNKKKITKIFIVDWDIQDTIYYKKLWMQPMG